MRRSERDQERHRDREQWDRLERLLTAIYNETLAMHQSVLSVQDLLSMPPASRMDPAPSNPSGPLITPGTPTPWGVVG